MHARRKPAPNTAGAFKIVYRYISALDILLLNWYWDCMITWQAIGDINAHAMGDGGHITCGPLAATYCRNKFPTHCCLTIFSLEIALLRIIYARSGISYKMIFIFQDFRTGAAGFGRFAVPHYHARQLDGKPAPNIFFYRVLATLARYCLFTFHLLPGGNMPEARLMIECSQMGIEYRGENNAGIIPFKLTSEEQDWAVRDTYFASLLRLLFLV